MAATLADIQKKFGDQVYPLYKDQMHEPYMEEDNKIGFKGTVLYDELEDKVMCSECGKWFNHLQAHVRIIHKKTLSDYKKDHGLNQQIALCSKRFSQERSVIAEEKISRFKFNKGHNIVRPRVTEERRLELMRVSKKNMQTKNKFGLCDAQIASRLLVVRDIAGKNRIEDLTSRDLENYDIKLYSALMRRYGSFEKACKSLNVTYIGQNKYSDSEMISGLRKFVFLNKRIPKASEAKFSKLRPAYLHPYDTYINHFGSWRRAKMMAGLDQLLEEVTRGKELEITIHLEKSKDSKLKKK